MIDMVNQSSTSSAADLLNGGSVLSFFPRTLRTLPPDPMAAHCVGEGDHDDGLRRLEAAALRNRSKFLEQAQTILNRSSHKFNTLTRSAMDVDHMVEAADAVTKDKSRERRPGLGLGRKRARFSLKPDCSQTAAIPEPTIDIGQFEDPEELFAAFDKMELAKKELRKLRGGGLTELEQILPSIGERRQRRPGLLGKSYSYIHRYPLETSDIGKKFLSLQEAYTPQEASAQDKSPPSRDFILPETNVDDISSETLSVSGKNLSGIFDQLMSDESIVDEGGAVKKLELLFPIKPLELSKSCLPQMCDIRETVSKSASEAFPSQSASNSVLYETMTTVPVDTSGGSSQMAGKSYHHMSPKRSKSPLASLLSLRRRITQSFPSNNPFRFTDPDSSPVRSFSSKELANENSDDTDKVVTTTSKKLDRSDQIASGEMNVPVMRNSLSSEDVMNASAIACGVCQDTACVDFSVVNKDSGDNNHDEEPDDKNHCKDSDDKNHGEEPVDNDHDKNQTHLCSEPKEFGDEVSEFVQSLQSELDSQDSDAETSGGSVSDASVSVDALSSVQEEGLGAAAMDTTGACGVREGGPVKSSAGVVKSKSTTKGKSKAAPSKLRRGKELSSRQSLAGAGTKWDGGVRRSSRFKTRPLKFWEGERMLYARIHESLVTAVGVKYISPTKSGQPKMKVKSLVSNKYKDLVYQMSRY